MVGSDDYDLRFDHTVIKYDRNNKVYSPSVFSVYVDHTALGQSSQLTKAIDWSTQNLELLYSVNGGSGLSNMPKEPLGSGAKGSIILSSGLFGSAEYPKLEIILRDATTQTVIDSGVIEVVFDGLNGKDGKDGKDGINASGFMLDFSNDSDQLYIDELGNLYAGQSIVTDIKGFKGATELTANVDF
jgi:hypothetical protein